MSTKTATTHLRVIEGGSEGLESSSISIANLTQRQVEFVRRVATYLNLSPPATRFTEAEIAQIVNQLLRIPEVRYHRIEGGGQLSPTAFAPSGWFLRSREEAATVDWQEKYLDKLDRDVSDMKAGLRATEERIAQMVNQTLSEMRDRDNQRHQEFINIRDLLIGERRWIIAMAVTTILGVASMVIMVLLGVWQIFR